MFHFHVSFRTATIHCKNLCWHKRKSPIHAWLRFPIDLSVSMCTIVFTLIFGCEASDSMLLIDFEGSFVSIAIGVYILSFASSLSIDVASIVLISIGVNSMTLSCVISWRISAFSFWVGELIWSSLFLCHWSCKYYNLKYRHHSRASASNKDHYASFISHDLLLMRIASFSFRLWFNIKVICSNFCCAFSVCLYSFAYISFILFFYFARLKSFSCFRDVKMGVKIKVDYFDSDHFFWSLGMSISSYFWVTSFFIFIDWNVISEPFWNCWAKF